METKGSVYFFRHIGLTPVKIGMTKNESVNSRMQSLKTYAPYGVEMLGSIKTKNPFSLEAKLHTELEKYRLQGEWFNIDENMVKAIIDREQSIVEKKLRLLFEQWLSENDVTELNLNSKFNDFIDKVVEKKSVDKIDSEAIELALSKFERPFYITVSDVMSLNNNLTRKEINTYLNWTYKKEKSTKRYISVITNKNTLSIPFIIS